MTREGLYVRGVEHQAAKLQDADVVRMREIAAGEKITLRELAARFGVTTTAVHRIITGTGWAHLDGPIREPRSYTKRK